MRDAAHDSADEFGGDSEDDECISNLKVKYTRIKETGRTVDAPPIRAPYDFGIDPAWYAANKDHHAIYLSDWMTYGDPPGFGASVIDDSRWSVAPPEGVAN